MIAEAGLAALWLAAALAALQLALACGLGGEEGRGIRAVRSVAIAQRLLTVAAFAALIVLFLRSDMSVLLVAARFCRERNALLIVDPPLDWTSTELALRSLRDWQFHHENALMYFPRLLAFDRRLERRETPFNRAEQVLQHAKRAVGR